MTSESMTLTATEQQPHSSDRDWFLGASRWTQLTFVENDPQTFDQDFWIDVMQRSGSNALCLSAGGYIAFYPTRIPLHYRSAELADGDPFGAMVEAARKLDMRVMARVDPHAIHDDAATARPDWLALGQDGEPLPHWSFPDIWLTCPFGSYHRDFITEVAREIVGDYQVDAIFANRWEGHGGVSYSEAARRGFFDATGLQLPRQDDPSDPSWPAYGAWRSRRLSELVVLWDDAVRAVRPAARFIPNRGSLLTRDLDRQIVDGRYPMFFIDKQGRSGREPIWTAGRIGKRSRGMFPERPVSLITSVGPESHEYRWKDSVAAPAELRSWIADGFAQGASPWFTKFNARIRDDRWVQPIVDAFGLHKIIDDAVGGLPFTERVAIFDNLRIDPARPFGPKVGDDPNEDGFYQALVEARVPFGYLADQELTAARLAEVDVLVLPDARAMSEEHCRVIEAYVAAGGSVVAAHRSSLLDEEGRQRADYGLGRLLGVSHRGGPRGPVKNNYIAITDRHPVAAGFDGAERIVGGTHLFAVDAAPDASVPFRFVPDFPDLPMEEVYPRQEGQVGDPAVVCREQPGGGRTAYVAFNVGEVFWDALQSDHGQLIANLVGWARGSAPAVRVTGAGLVDLSVRADEATTAVTLVNLNNPMAMRGQQRSVLPLPPQELLLVAPPGCSGADARLVVAGQHVPAERLPDGRFRVSIPSVGVIETVIVHWG
ncbi:alpha-amylase family protein [Microlunatus soli]|uniref:Beta-galactosidase trimerisation domain-containing protein n=1 Tax=Microlunatus soli TaxID=630515 RepID=A0A1H1XTT6_9ACTN|nr:alpha-amylase family protein [Microlunatus soli]SDT12572.1 Beta-galactosidase trimerisation domain-containing protein [Microlunatus soli]